MRKQKLPKIIHKKSNQKIRESGCCFRSCGGVPVCQQDNPEKIFELSSVKRLLSKVK
jgi:hypothetical protein